LDFLFHFLAAFFASSAPLAPTFFASSTPLAPAFFAASAAFSASASAFFLALSKNYDFSQWITV